MLKKSQKLLSTVAMLIAIIYFFKPEKPVMAYLEYLPVYRVELRWDKALEHSETTPLQPLSKELSTQ